MTTDEEAQSIAKGLVHRAEEWVSAQERRMAGAQAEMQAAQDELARSRAYLSGCQSLLSHSTDAAPVAVPA